MSSPIVPSFFLAPQPRSILSPAIAPPLSFGASASVARALEVDLDLRHLEDERRAARSLPRPRVAASPSARVRAEDPAREARALRPGRGRARRRASPSIGHACAPREHRVARRGAHARLESRRLQVRRQVDAPRHGGARGEDEVETVEIVQVARRPVVAARETRRGRVSRPPRAPGRRRPGGGTCGAAPKTERCRPFEGLAEPRWPGWPSFHWNRRSPHAAGAVRHSRRQAAEAGRARGEVEGLVLPRELDAQRQERDGEDPAERGDAGAPARRTRRPDPEEGHRRRVPGRDGRRGRARSGRATRRAHATRKSSDGLLARASHGRTTRSAASATSTPRPRSSGTRRSGPRRRSRSRKDVRARSRKSAAFVAQGT